MSDRPLEGFGTVVVGGSRGIGAAVSALLAGCGAGVVVNGRDAAAVDATVSSITSAGGAALSHAGSAAEESVAQDLIALCEKEFGAVDALVNCAGAPEPPGSSILNVTTDEFRRLIDVHLITTFATCRAVAPKMVARGRGAIVNTSSFAFLGDYGGTGYPAGKGGVNGLTMAIAAELAEYGVRANVVCPGAKTRLSTGPEFEEQIASLRQRGLLDEVSAQGALDAAPPEYVAPMYGYLVSDLARSITGQIFIAAGGFVGRFDRPSPSLIGYRDHHDSPPWSLDEIAAMLA
ncbi:SDR family NAD(P)-dependent oxidoreductase [Mycobacterium sp. CVI_P3]|uniref:SDR family NAD(P)-dependent oxidoreductase n=1 Tax=Mycobacterium pinniadriaticum TaxID=2994102 RepID=A0ABT3S8M6_9MYCO|nr:SDR family oxidoreductase [Mycobacterium pinniadriaticum]MCX2928876.1 SDR family NAD(P)-dependent oxidoreductase [Mycobacterium pinniadriaticum]MCX2935257.1 SDR family NAD(P)-dependent oxidoreductase [Mycobacterium pinniadriaticum]